MVVVSDIMYRAMLLSQSVNTQGNPIRLLQANSIRQSNEVADACRHLGSRQLFQDCRLHASLHNMRCAFIC